MGVPPELMEVEGVKVWAYQGGCSHPNTCSAYIASTGLRACESRMFLI